MGETIACFRYSEAELFRLAFKHVNEPELLEVLINEFGLNVNWRKDKFYDTLLYESLKGSDISVARYLISKGACVNCSLGGYPKEPNDHGYLSLYDVVDGNQSLASVGGRSWLRQFGAISFENLPEDKKDKVINSVDFTKEARKDVYLYRTEDQLKISILKAPEQYRTLLKKEFCNYYNLVDVDLEKEEAIAGPMYDPKRSRI